MTTHTVVPTNLADRIDTLDVLRGVAICGILLMNIPGMGMIGEREAPPLPAIWNADWVAWGVQSLLFEGTMRGLFTMLFGAGMLLMLRRADDGQVTPIDVWTRRCLALMVLGLVQCAVFLWRGEILWCYGVTGLGLLAFRTTRPRVLVGVGLAALALLTTLDVKAGYDRFARIAPAPASIVAKAAGKPLNDGQKAALKAVEESRKRNHPTPAEIAKETTERTHWPSVLGWSWGDWSEYNLGPEGWDSVLESFSFMLIGMALFRTGILTGTASRTTYMRLMLIGYGGGLGLRVLRMTLSARTGFDLDLGRLVPWEWMYRSGMYEPARLLVTLYRSGTLGRATPLKALGRMALTVYSLESILTSMLFYGLGYVGVFGFAQLMGIAVVIWVACVLFCLWWLHHHTMGPAEALLRAVAYGTFRRPWRRAEATQVLATAPPV